MSSNIHDRARSRCVRPAELCYCLSTTEFGPVAVLWSAGGARPKIRRIVLSTPELSAERVVHASYSDVTCSSCAEIERIADKITAFMAGEDVRFSLDDALLEACSPFQQRVLRADYRIPRGRVSSYQRIAGLCGCPKGARAVGTALATNPFPIVVPCHRVIRSDGTLGGFGGGLRMKRDLLALEGVTLDPSGRVAITEFC